MVQPEYSAQGLSLSDSLLYVLFAGTTDNANRLVDRYRLQDGSYLGTMLLPKPVAGLAVQGSDVYVVFNSPYPTVQRLRSMPALEETSLR